MPVEINGFLNIDIYLYCVKSAVKCLCSVRFFEYSARRLYAEFAYGSENGIIENKNKEIISGLVNDIVNTLISHL